MDFYLKREREEEEGGGWRILFFSLSLSFYSATGSKYRWQVMD